MKGKMKQKKNQTYVIRLQIFMFIGLLMIFRMLFAANIRLRRR